MKRNTIDQELFELVESLGETLDGKIHILDISGPVRGTREENDVVWRIYHADGYCMTVKREPNFDGDEKLRFDYDFDGSEEEFKSISSVDALRLLKDHFNIKK